MHLRAKRFNGLKFRRQHPIGPYIVDFVCIEKQLVIEVDGGQHNYDDISILDLERTEWLNEQGYKLIRFWNNEVLTNTDSVLESIWEACNETSPSL